MQSVLGKDSEKHEEKDHLNAHDGSWWEAKEIIGERKNEYKVSWAGIDPATGKTYKPCWVRKSDCTEELLNTWIKSDKQRKTKKSANLAKKKASQGENDEHSSNVPEKKHKGAFKNVCNEFDVHHLSEDTFDAIDMPDTFDSSLPYTTDSQNRPYLKSFESLEYTQHLSEISISINIFHYL
ncbi:hypothetical protein PORY_000244 [Pneumocystis oryctolagi]|uniref:Uncharacterized protein n=1 Tax=Pneumocystis oryctolagi TaxID=42067 RepID=A0ACB7CEN2_9ASCO|nr:hypothetical protein PORY_000244 [Pneumocystis oryctolagi]